MTPTTAALVAGIFFCLGCAFIVFPAASFIPAQMDRQWALEVEAQSQSLPDRARPADYSYSTVQKAIFTAIAGAVGYAVITVHGTGADGLAFALYYFGLLLLVAINLKSALLPDMLVLPVLWAGLLYFTYAGTGKDHVYGAAAGFLVLFSVMFAVKIMTGKEVIGRGDLKAMAMAGAWFGLAGLPLLLAGYVAGVVAWPLIRLLGGQRSHGFVCTGPAHLAGALAATLGAGATALPWA